MSNTPKSVKAIESSKTNNHKVQESLESYKVSHDLIQNPHEKFTLHIPFKFHIRLRVCAI
jgi:hypothetical protein